MSQVLDGTQAALTLASIQMRMANLLGQNPNSNRFKNLVLEWCNDTIQEIQLSDPELRRTVVHEAPFNVTSGNNEYDVRDTVENGGFNWPNCFEVLSIVIPDISTRPLEPMTLNQWRNRSYILSDTGPPYGWVMLDQFRIKLVPTPSGDYEGVGDYKQNIPTFSDAGAYIDWPRPWDSVLLKGVKARGKEWHFDDQPGAYLPAWRIYQDAIDDMSLHDRQTNRVPRRAIVTRHQRSRRHVASDNSTDYRYRY